MKSKEKGNLYLLSMYQVSYNNPKGDVVRENLPYAYLGSRSKPSSPLEGSLFPPSLY